MNKEAIINEILSERTISLECLITHPFAKVAISAGELIFRTNRRSIKYVKGCVATAKRNDPKNGRWTFSVRCNQNWSKGPYDVRFKLLKSKGLKTKGILGREIKVSCNCNAWKYNGADFNALDKDYSERQYSNGQPPNKRDPQRRFLICKHVAACIPLFRRFIIPEGFKEEPMFTKPKKQLIQKSPKKLIQEPKIKKEPEKPPTRPEIVKKPTRIKPLKVRKSL
jgi:hypothetical protein